MVFDEVYFGGEVLPCLVEKFPVIRKAKRKYKSYNIPGRNGDIVIQQDAYENVILPYVVACGQDDVQSDWTDLANVLYKDGYQTLSDIADPEHFRKAVFNGPIDAEYYWQKVGRTTLEFNCRPERYRNDGQVVFDYEETVTVKKWQKSQLSALIQAANWWAGTTEFYQFDIPSSWGKDLWILNFVNWHGDGWMQYINIHSNSPDTATGGTFSSNKYMYNGKFTLDHSDVTILIPVQYFDGAPMLQGTDALDTTEKYNYGASNASQIITNNYMPCYPDIILKNSGAYTGEILAAHINWYGIYITYDQYSPYYFIDTENATITKSDTLNGNRILASNARMDAGIKLEKGENIIYTSYDYSIPSLVTNFWEL